MNTNRTVLLVSAMLATGISFSSVHAGTWAEVGDAGDLTSTAQSTDDNGVGAPLTQITGTLYPSQPDLPDVDLYCIRITSPASGFSAALVPTQDSTELAPLYLFDQMGFGVTSQEGFYNSNTPSALTGQFVPGPGLYYLGIGPHDLFAHDAQGTPLWGGNPGIERPPINTGYPLAQWFGMSSFFFPFGAYEINLTGAAFGNCDLPSPTERTTWGQIKRLYH